MSAVSRRAARLVGFDGLRAVAALSVLSYHVALWGGFATPAIAPLLWELKGGVAIFFVISGALLYLPYARAIRDRRRLPGSRHYARRRAVRILPAYWVALSVVAIGPFGGHVIGPQVWEYYGLSQIYDPRALLGGVGVAWSLCIEVTFYAVLPLFAWLAARAARHLGQRATAGIQLALITIVGSSSLALRIALAGSVSAPVPFHGQAVMVTLPGLLDWFAIGMGLAVFRAELEAGRATNSRLAALAASRRLCLLLGAGAFLVGVPAQQGDIFLPWYGALTHLSIGVGSGLLVLAVIVPDAGGERSSAMRLLAGSKLTWVGMISYGIYLWHLQALQLIERIVPSPSAAAHLTPAAAGTIVLVWLSVVAGAVLVGAASWYLVEQPTQRALRARERRSEEAAASGRRRHADAGVQSVPDGLNPAGVTADHLA